ncbi:hypothetical protein [Mycolicibacterium vinylchloridicum]|uniref:hypothetical protein n=1 Tax=Mycolicibacterium vinylchloridicum TaxID=2736928 RepID=UPI0015C8D038|nr:hypothetical protein [Mycolicibacterium vinylchloridicum]
MILRPLHAGAMIALGAAVIGTVVACSPSSEAAPGSPGGPDDPFVACMTENGVPAPTQGPPPQGGPSGQPGGPPPQGGPGGQGQGGQPPAPPGVDQSVWDRGLQACASLAPAPPQH